MIRQEGQVCPDGVVIGINWEKFVVGASVFIPAINLTELNKQMQIIANEKEIKLKGFDRIEAGKLGMRTGYRDWETDRKSTRLNSSHRL